jgi:hypothetical protein
MTLPRTRVPLHIMQTQPDPRLGVSRKRSLPDISGWRCRRSVGCLRPALTRPSLDAVAIQGLGSAAATTGRVAGGQASSRSARARRPGPRCRWQRDEGIVEAWTRQLRCWSCTGYRPRISPPGPLRSRAADPAHRNRPSVQSCTDPPRPRCTEPQPLREPQVLLKHPSSRQSGLRKEVPSKATIVCFPLIASGLSPSAL